MGILNATPDSFSDGGLFLDPGRAVEHAIQMEKAGADLIDIGGESTRPGAIPVPEEEELRRVLPVITALIRKIKIPLSIDTTKAEVARAALDAGASVINDISGVTADAKMFAVAAKSNCGLIIMHSRGTPQTMQRHPRYTDLIGEIRSFLKNQIQKGIDRGISKTRMVIDPGIGFGKTVNHNLTLLNRLSDFVPLGVPLLIGPSRKSFIGKVWGSAPGQQTAPVLEGTAAAVAICILHGARILRVHDVAFMVRVARIADAILKGYRPW